MLSVVLPAYNEADNVRPMVESGIAALGGLVDALEFVVVDDGSTDQTWAVLSGMAARDGRVRPVRHVTNRGYGAALKTGLGAARHDLIFFTDADRQFDMSEVARLLEKANHWDVVAGYRAPRRDSAIRRLNAVCWTHLVNQLYGLGVRDVNCAFKLFHRRVLDTVEIRSQGALVNTEILAQVRGAGFRIAEVPVRHYPRVAGIQTGGRLDVILKAMAELALNHRRIRGFSRPRQGRPASSRPPGPT